MAMINPNRPRRGVGGKEGIAVTPYFQDKFCTIYHGDCREILPELPKVDAIITDPPYYKVKTAEWDRQWATKDAFITFIREMCGMWYELLAPNGSLYCFASPQMSARVEVTIGETFNVLNNIRWVKTAGWHNKTEKDALRMFLSPYESIIFAEHYGADNIAKGEAGYVAQCDDLRGFVFEPLRSYLDAERERAGVSVRRVAEAFQRKTGSRTVTGMAGHWFSRVQWSLPTESNYLWMRSLFNDEYLRKEYEELRKEYEELRRPFAVSADVPYTDVWDFPTVQYYKGKHECEKPVDMMLHMIRTSSRPGNSILDPFMGSGTTLVAAKQLQRQAIGIELEEKYCEIAADRLRQGILELY